MLITATTRAWLMVGGIFLAIAVAIFLIDRAFAWLGKHGAKSLHNEKAGGGGMAGLLSSFEEFVHPEMRHVQEEREQRKAETKQTDPSDH
jgi:hypothetical protein